jgi:hypothetical protein
MCFPVIKYNISLTSGQILNGEPPETNYGYSFSKRLMYVGSKLLTKETDDSY